MKKHLALLAATAVLGVTSAFAANPFSDVTPQDWAYQAVAQLASQGIVNGYPDGTFQGQHNITRYEMAQMVAKAMTRQDRVDAEQNAIINRLANEFSAELNNLGVRVAGLEDKVGNFKFTGDARMRYMGYSKEGQVKNTEHGTKSRFDYRGRVKFEATVNDNTKAVVRLAGSKEFGNTGTAGASMDRVYVQHNFGQNVTATVGRHDLLLGQGLTYDDAFEGVTAKFGTDKLNATLAYGYMTEAGFALYNPSTKIRVTQDLHEFAGEHPQFTIAQVDGKLGNKVDVSAFYVKTHKQEAMADFAPYGKRLVKAGDGFDFYGAALTADLGSKVKVNGEFAKFKDLKDSNAWVAGITYGDYSIKAPNTWDVRLHYMNFDTLAPVLSSTYAQPYNQNYRTWLAQADYALAKNVGLSAYAAFASKVKHAGDDNKKAPNFYRAELNYKF